MNDQMIKMSDLQLLAVPLLAVAQFVQAVVGDLQRPATRDEAVGRLEITVDSQLRLVQVNHALKKFQRSFVMKGKVEKNLEEIFDEGGDKESVELQVLVP